MTYFVLFLMVLGSLLVCCTLSVKKGQETNALCLLIALLGMFALTAIKTALTLLEVP